MSEPELVYQLSFSGPGPWLIDTERLRVLDEIIEEQRQRIAEAREITIKKALDEEVQSYIEDPVLKPRTPEDLRRLRWQLRNVILEQYSHVRQRDNVEITLGDTKRLMVRSFADAETHLPYDLPRDERALGFEVYLEHDEVTCKIALYPHHGLLQIAAYPGNVPAVQQFYADARAWARAVQPSGWQQLWRRLGGLTWPLALAALPVLFGGIELLSRRPSAAIVEQARSLLDHPITARQTPRAVALLLHLSLDRLQPPSPPHGPLVLFIAGAVVCSVLAFPPPHALLGIGRSEQLIAQWRRWMGLVSYTMPVFFLVSVAALLFIAFVSH